jgi:hypothetical protein
LSNIVEQFGFAGSDKANIRALIDFVNSFSDVIDFTVVTAGAEVEISHGLEAIPSQVFPVIKEGDTVSFANVFAGSTAWTTSKIYLTASLAGNYHVILRK